MNTPANGAGNRPGRAAAWLRAVRPFAFTASVTPVLVAAAVAAAHPAQWELLPLVVVGVVLLHAGTNLISEARDFARGLDTADSLGSRNVLVDGLLRPREVFIAGVVALVLGASVGGLLAWLCEPVVLWLALVGLLGGLFYSARPIGYKYLALGDPLVFVLMGPLIVIGSHLVLTGQVTAKSLWASLPVGCLVAGILSANNLRDIQHDARAGVYTIARLLGPRGAKAEYVLLVAGAYGLVVVAAAAGVMSPWALLVLLSAPLAVRNVAAALRAPPDRPQQIAHLDADTAKLHFLFGLLLAAGLLVGSLIAGS